eukprot:CAMPEP_0206542698 /NCGR_PEP_ID=MMETSP0325_2-20121206/10338_1 /ASSEMBLY_ACC=CAM_ASM_000347 /TAXON_ID=2866 /ORGANISM="Crypthecodinium cohnii, Strain Seligo" /LENGTH=657 /DNA_ID=CAMNT_0054040827 /DNA_START=104 /DNA_END=2074 /DNA_ORIENTATION=-
MPRSVQLLALLAVLGFTAFAKGDGSEEEKLNVDGPVIGIDLGTTYSCVGIFKNGRVEIIANDQGNRITPSYVAFADDERLVGEAAKNQATINPTQTVFDAKRLIGRRFKESTVQKDMKHFPFEVVDKNGKPQIQVKVNNKKKTFAPEEISAMVLGKMREIAENYLGRKVAHAVITVPAYFNDQQRQSTKDAGAISGLNVLRIINEPTAAAIAYGLDKQAESNILVYDLGGGTFDVSILTIDNGIFEVVATNGDTHLGGEDFDQRVMEHFIKVFKKKHGSDLTQDKRAVQKLRREVEKAKRALSSTHTAQLEIEALYQGIDFSESLTRAKFEELNTDLFKKTMGPVKKVLEDSGLKKSEIHEIVLVGGSTRIPKVQQLIKEHFGGKEPNRGINPDEAVAYGAAVQGGILSGESGQELLLLDVTPLSLGTEVEGGTMAVLISRNTVIPARKTDSFTTVTDNQPAIDFKVYEGERPMAKDNHLLGKFTLDGLAPVRAGVPDIEVTYEVDANGILNVAATDKATGKGTKITITNNKGRLTEAQIARMVQEAEEFAEQDRVVKERADARQALQSYIRSMRDSSRSWGAKVKADEVKSVESALSETESWLLSHQDADVEDINEQKSELESVCNPIIEQLYGKQRSRGDGGREDSDDEGDFDDE